MTTAAVLWDRAADLELEIATLEAELEAFHADYLRAVGVFVAEYHAVQAKLLAATGDVRGAAAAEEDARRSAADIAAIPPPAGPPPTEDIKALFRSAAKRMHPDLSRDEEGRRHAEAFMKRLNAYYKAGDAGAMADLVRQWEGSPEGGDDDVSAAQAAVASAEARLAEARESDVARMLDEALAAELRGEDYLADLKVRWTNALRDARERLAAVG